MDPILKMAVLGVIGGVIGILYQLVYSRVRKPVRQERPFSVSKSTKRRILLMHIGLVPSVGLLVWLTRLPGSLKYLAPIATAVCFAGLVFVFNKVRSKEIAVWHKCLLLLGAFIGPLFMVGDFLNDGKVAAGTLLIVFTFEYVSVAATFISTRVDSMVHRS